MHSYEEAKTYNYTLYNTQNSTNQPSSAKTLD